MNINWGYVAAALLGAVAGMLIIGAIWLLGAPLPPRDLPEWPDAYTTRMIKGCHGQCGTARIDSLGAYQGCDIPPPTKGQSCEK